MDLGNLFGQLRLEKIQLGPRWANAGLSLNSTPILS